VYGGWPFFMILFRISMRLDGLDDT